MKNINFKKLNQELWFELIEIIDNKTIKTLRISGQSKMELILEDKSFASFLTNININDFNSILFSASITSYIEESSYFKFLSPHNKHYINKVFEIKYSLRKNNTNFKKRIEMPKDKKNIFNTPFISFTNMDLIF